MWFLFLFLIIGGLFLIYYIVKSVRAFKIESICNELSRMVTFVTNWDLNKYTKNLEGKKIIYRKYDRHNYSEIIFGTYGFSYYFSYSYSSIRSVEFQKNVVGYYRSIIITIGYQDFHGSTLTENFEFSYNCLDKIAEFYRIILNIIAINKKSEENLLNRVFSSQEEIDEFNRKLCIVKGKQILLDTIAKEYETDIFNLIMSIDKNFRFNYFKLLENDKMSEGCLAKDGFYGYNKPENAEEENFLLFSKGLKGRIKSKWKDKETLNIATYLILRNSVINYYNKYYELNYKGVNLEGFCGCLTKVKEKELSFYKIIFACHYVYENDIYLSIGDIYSKFCKEIDETIEKVATEQREQALFNREEEINNNETKGYNIEKVVNLPIEKIDAMTGEEFEIFIADYFKKLGYKATVTPLSGDYGVDVIVESELAKIGIQAKRYEDRVTNSAIQEIVAGIKHYNLDKGMVITNNYFTRAAKELAKDNNITLWDRKTLMEKIKNWESEI